MKDYQINLDEFKEIADLSIHAFVPHGNTQSEYTVSLSQELNKMRSLLYKERDEILLGVNEILDKKELKLKLDSIIVEREKGFIREYKNKIFSINL